MKYCEDCTSATWCYDQGKCDRAKVEVSEAALESLKAMAQRLQDERDELLHALKGVLLVGRGTSGRLIIEGWQEKAIQSIIAKFTEKPEILE